MSAALPDRPSLTARQAAGLRTLFDTVLATNPFYQRKLVGLPLTEALDSPAEFAALIPFTTKAELVEDQQWNPVYGSNLTFPLKSYVRCHATSGTSGQPLRWLDTAESWQALLQHWVEVYRAAGVTAGDRIFFAFSFGPFLGFWTAFEAGTQIGCLCLPGGSLNTLARLKAILENSCTVLCCTPTYAIHLAETAAREGISLAHSPVKQIIVAGEPGGSIPATRQRIEQLWRGATVFDHHGMTEVGPVSVPCPAHPGRLHILESYYLAEIIDPATGKLSPPNQPGELVLTPLERIGSPLIRYRTSDWVQPLNFVEAPCACGRWDLALEGGILGRTDDMVIVRGVNVYPAAIEQLVRQESAVVEYSVLVSQHDAMCELEVSIEVAPDEIDSELIRRRLEKTFETALVLRVPVKTVAAGSLPRFELKAKRWVRAI